jgi:hypothetical protein
MIGCLFIYIFDVCNIKLMRREINARCEFVWMCK